MTIFAAVVEVQQNLAATPITNSAAATSLMWADYVILTVILLSTLISLVRGFVKEALSLATWVFAAVLAVVFSPQVAALLEKYIEVPSIRTFIAFAAIFIVTLIAGGIINLIISAIIKHSGQSTMDKFIGMFFGFARGVLVVAIIVLLLGLTPIPQDPWWKQSVLLPSFELLANWVQGFLPEQWNSYFNFKV